MLRGFQMREERKQLVVAMAGVGPWAWNPRDEFLEQAQTRDINTSVGIEAPFPESFDAISA